MKNRYLAYFVLFSLTACGDEGAAPDAAVQNDASMDSSQTDAFADGVLLDGRLADVPNGPDAALVDVGPPAEGEVTLRWDAPMTLGDGADIGGSLLGYRVFRDDGAGFTQYGADLGADAIALHVPATGRYAVQARFIDDGFEGQSALSLPADAGVLFRADECSQVFTPADDRTTIQDAIDGAAPGDRLCFRGNDGPYTFDWATNAAPLEFRNGGVKGNPVFISAYPGDARPRFFGPMTTDLAQTAEANDEAVEPTRQVLFRITSDNYVIEGLEISRATRTNIELNCSNNILRDLISEDSYDGHAISIGPDSGTDPDCARGVTNNNLVQNVVAAFSRHASGVYLHKTGNEPNDSREIVGTRMVNILSWGHGRRRESPMHLEGVPGIRSDDQGGGNSDAFGVFKALGCSDSGTTCPGPAQDTTWANVYGLMTQDNCLDLVGGGTIHITRLYCANRRDSIMGQSTSSGAGTGGVKNFAELDPGVVYRVLGHVSYANNSADNTAQPAGETFQIRVMPEDNGDVLLAHATATDVAGKTMDVGGNMSSETPATHRLWASVADGGDPIVTRGAGGTWSTQWNIDSMDGDASPGYGRSGSYDPTPPTMLCPGCAPRHALELQRQELERNLMVARTSNVHELVPRSTELMHDERLADDPIAPADPEHETRIACFAHQHAGDTERCDSGAIHYQFMLPPTNLRFD